MSRFITPVSIALALLIAVVALGRLLPHPPNFTPLAAASLFAGFLLRRHAWAVFVPVAGLLLSDALLGTYDWRVMAAVYLGMVLPALAWPLLGRRPGATAIAGTAIGAGVVFFLVSNTGVWLFSGLYPMTAAGLFECFALAVPFFKFTVLGNLVFAGAFFGMWYWLGAPRAAEAPALESA